MDFNCNAVQFLGRENVQLLGETGYKYKKNQVLYLHQIYVAVFM